MQRASRATVQQTQHKKELNVTVLFIQLIANILTHDLLSADDRCQRVQTRILD